MHPRYRRTQPLAKRALRHRRRPVRRLAVVGCRCSALLALADPAADGGPVFFRQRPHRRGRSRRSTMLKLRTMRDAAVVGAQWAEPRRRPRVTTVGRLPAQARTSTSSRSSWNVLRGDMSARRPAARAARRSSTAPRAAASRTTSAASLVKPGITGWAQVRCGYAGSDDRLRLEALPRPLLPQAPLAGALNLVILGETLRTVVADRGHSVQPSGTRLPGPRGGRGGRARRARVGRRAVRGRPRRGRGELSAGGAATGRAAARPAVPDARAQGRPTARAGAPAGIGRSRRRPRARLRERAAGAAAGRRGPRRAAPPHRPPPRQRRRARPADAAAGPAVPRRRDARGGARGAGAPPAGRRPRRAGAHGAVPPSAGPLAPARRPRRLARGEPAHAGPGLPTPPPAAAAGRGLACMRRYEAQAVARADSASLVATADRDSDPSLSGAAVVANGVDLDRFAFRAPDDRLPVLLFSGNLGYFHNVAPAILVARQVLPLVRRDVPEARLRVAGARPAAAVRALAALDGVTVAAGRPVDGRRAAGSGRRGAPRAVRLRHEEQGAGGAGDGHAGRREPARRPGRRGGRGRPPRPPRRGRRGDGRRVRPPPARRPTCAGDWRRTVASSSSGPTPGRSERSTCSSSGAGRAPLRSRERPRRPPRSRAAAARSSATARPPR